MALKLHKIFVPVSRQQLPVQIQQMRFWNGYQPEFAGWIADRLRDFFQFFINIFDVGDQNHVPEANTCQQNPSTVKFTMLWVFSGVIKMMKKPNKYAAWGRNKPMSAAEYQEWLEAKRKMHAMELSSEQQRIVPDMPKGSDWNMSLNQMLSGMHELTQDDLIDMWQKAKALPEPERQKAIRYITHLSTRLESRPAQVLVGLLLETL